MNILCAVKDAGSLNSKRVLVYSDKLLVLKDGK
jgi:hypothetical protein